MKTFETRQLLCLYKCYDFHHIAKSCHQGHRPALNVQVLTIFEIVKLRFLNIFRCNFKEALGDLQVDINNAVGTKSVLFLLKRLKGTNTMCWQPVAIKYISVVDLNSTYTSSEGAEQFLPCYY